MKVSRNDILFFLLLIFLLNSAGIFSPSLTVRSDDWVTDLEVSSNMVNRLVMLTSFLISILYLYQKAMTAKLVLIKSIPMLMLIFFALLSCFWSDIPTTSFTRLLQQVFIFSFLLAIVCHLEFEKIFSVLKLFAIIVLLVGIISLPFSFAWQDIGFRSIHGHKNTAGYIYALSSLVLLFDVFIEKNKTKINYAILLGLFLLLVITKSKTSLALTLISFTYTLFLFKHKRINALPFILCIWVGALAIFTMLLITDTQTLTELGLDFTGRAIIWEFILSEMQGFEWFGVGYRAFWGIGEEGLSILYGADYDAFITKLNQSHNSYLDIWVMLGFVGLAIFILFKIHSLVLISRSNYLYIAFLLFITIHSFMETDFFRSNNLVWVLYTLLYLSSIKKGLKNDK